MRDTEDAERAERQRGRPKKLISACDTYRLVVGEIGIDRKEFLDELLLWEIKAIIRGYNDRALFGHRTAWEAARWQTSCILQVLGCKSVSKPSDLMTFPWEKEEKAEREVDDAEALAMVKELEEINKRGGVMEGRRPRSATE